MEFTRPKLKRPSVFADEKISVNAYLGISKRFLESKQRMKGIMIAVVIKEDGAPSPFAWFIVDYLNHAFSDRKNLLWLPKICDLQSLDLIPSLTLFWNFKFLNLQTFKVKIHSIEQLKQRITVLIRGTVPAILRYVFRFTMNHWLQRRNM